MVNSLSPSSNETFVTVLIVKYRAVGNLYAPEWKACQSCSVHPNSVTALFTSMAEQHLGGVLFFVPSFQGCHSGD